MRQKTVLIVEDNGGNRAIYAAALQHAGYAVVEAEDGAEGVRQARESVSDLILMDLSMPVLDGWGAIRLLSKDAATAHIPVWALSAHVLLEGDYERVRAAGFACYLTKPIEPKRVLEEVRARIGPARAA